MPAGAYDVIALARTPTVVTGGTAAKLRYFFRTSIESAFRILVFS